MKRGRKASILFGVVLLLFMIGITGTYAWEIEQQVINNLQGTKTKQMEVELIKLEKQDDSSAEERRIPNTTFHLFRENGTQIGGRYVTDEKGSIHVSLPEGKYYFEEVMPCIGYTYDTDAEGNRITKYPFEVTEQEETITVKAYNIGFKGSLMIRKTIENLEDAEMIGMQEKTLFTFTVHFSDQGRYTYRIDEGEEQSIQSGETLKLRHGETAVFQNLPVGLLYNVTETPMQGYTTQSTGHRGNITEEGAVAEFVNTCDTEKLGALTVTKKVENNENVEQEFSFTATLGDMVETFTLKAGESITWEGLPTGMHYTVTEQPAEGYNASVNQYQGEIVEADTVRLTFVNINQTSSETELGSLAVTKQVQGEVADENKEFAFNIVFGEGENAWEEAFTLKAEETKFFWDLPAGTVYTVTETDASAYLPTITEAKGTIVADYTGEVTFTNIVSEMPSPSTMTRLTVEKLLDGELLLLDYDKEFSMILIVDGEQTEFTMKAGDVKEFFVPVGSSYEVQEKDYLADGFSQKIQNGYGTATEEAIEVFVSNTYVGELRTEISGIKLWDMRDHTELSLPEAITVQLKKGDTLLEEKQVTPDEEGMWRFTFTAPKYNEDGTEAEYRFEEVPIAGYRVAYAGYNIINTYVAPVQAELPVIVKEIQGESSSEAIFEFIFQGETGAPMPEGSEGNEKKITLNGAGIAEIGTLTFTAAGDYSYRIYETNPDQPGWKYDTAVYTVLYHVVDKSTGLSYEQTIIKNEIAEEQDVTAEGCVRFTNVYTEPVIVESVQISGTKTWDHGSNPAAKRPSAILVYLYADGELYAQKQVTEKDNWQYQFEAPRFDENEDEIIYTIDEAQVTGYSKQINGYNLHNTYTGSAASGTGRPGVSQTGDHNKSWIWLMLMLLSLMTMILTVQYDRGQLAGISVNDLKVIWKGGDKWLIRNRMRKLTRDKRIGGKRKQWQTKRKR